MKNLVKNVEAQVETEYRLVVMELNAFTQALGESIEEEIGFEPEICMQAYDYPSDIAVDFIEEGLTEEAVDALDSIGFDVQESFLNTQTLVAKLGASFFEIDVYEEEGIGDVAYLSIYYKIEKEAKDE